MNHLIKLIYRRTLDLILPLRCVACNTSIESNVHGPICLKCLDAILIFRRFSELRPEVYLAAIGLYEDIILRKLIQQLKYRKLRSLKGALAELIRRYFLNVNPAKIVGGHTVVVPVPLHPRRERERGFNQAEIIARFVGEETNIPVVQNALRRVKNTKPQTTQKNNEERRENIKGSFGMRRRKAGAVKGKNVILVDDVYTSGATTNEAIKTLRRAGAKRILIFVIARA